MRLLIVSPDYASHALPMIEVGRRWAATEGEVVVATGPATRPLVEAAGLSWIELRLGKGSNRGVIEVTEQPPGEDALLQAFFDATRRGPIDTLLHQARLRLHDLLHEPDAVFDRLDEILAAVRPDRIVVDHVAFGARLALHAHDAPAATMVLGHPTALPAPGEWYGMPPAWPRAIQPSDDDLTLLETSCRASVEQLSDAALSFLARRAPRRRHTAR
jgi:UDP:flavonoid glycosyltransferase YjiC (YdhE family)